MCDLPRRPDRSLKLFEADGAWQQCGGVYNGEDTGCGDAWDAYALGYREAVQCLVGAVEKKEFGYNTFGYPIFFLVHQYLELRMKEIIKNGRPLVDDNRKLKPSHCLWNLWIDCKEILKKIEVWEEYNDLDDETRQDYLTMDHFIGEINRDTQAQSFRYPVDTKNRPLLNDASIHTLNVKNLGVVFDWISNMLEGISTGIDEEKKARAEYEAEYRGEYTP